MTHDQQPQLWESNQNNLVFADLCNALYERELKKLSLDVQVPQAYLLKRIASLPYYIKRASQRIIDFYSPLDLDSQNASWIYRQPSECPGPKQKPIDIAKFYHANAQIGLIVPIYRKILGEEVIVLDSIDGIRENRIHTNEHGWFLPCGTADEPEGNNNTSKTHYQLLKPLKVTMTCACSGHKWLNSKRYNARALSLREMLLATNINWKNFAKVVAK